MIGIAFLSGMAIGGIVTLICVKGTLAYVRKQVNEALDILNQARAEYAEVENSVDKILDEVIAIASEIKGG